MAKFKRVKKDNEQLNESSNNNNQKVIPIKDGSLIPILREVKGDTFKSKRIINQLNSFSLKHDEQTRFEYEKLVYLFNNFQSLESKTENFQFEFEGQTHSIDPLYIHEKITPAEEEIMGRGQERVKNNFSRISALILYNYEISKNHTIDQTFINFEFKDFKEAKIGGKPTPIWEYELEIDTGGLARYLYQNVYREYAIYSSQQSSSDEPYYFYDVNIKRWSMISENYLSRLISGHVQNILTVLNADKISNKTNEIVKIIFNSFEKILDGENNLINEFSTSDEYAHLVQFKDQVYDMLNDEIYDMNRKYMLQNYHDYRLELYNDNNEKYTDDELRQKCSTVLERLKIIHYEEDFEFILSLIGHCFIHQNIWQTFPIIVGGGGLGKSWFYDEFVASNVIGNSNKASLDQDHFEKGSDFVLSSIYAKEINITNETNGSYLSPTVLKSFKTMGGTVTINQKFKKPFNSKVTAQFIMLGNNGQIPAIPSNSADDSGLLRRFVIINCKDKSSKDEFQQEKRKSVREYFSISDLKKEIPYFALLCMRTFIKNEKNRAIFDDTGGATERVIDGFTSKNIVDGTKAYFKSHNRNREFLLWLGHYYNKNHKDELKSTVHFNKWLTELKSEEVKNMYIWWFNHNYRHINAKKTDLEQYLKNTYHIQSYNLKITEGNKRVSGKRYGAKFADVVESIILEDDPEIMRFESSYSDLIDEDNQY